MENKASQEGSSGGCNVDRLRPRGSQRKRGWDRSEDGGDKKRLKEGSEEMEKLRSLVPSLRETSGRLSQVDIIEETISYIDSLHRRVAQRMVPSSSYPELTLDHVQEAERLSQDLASSEEQFRARLAAFSQSTGSEDNEDRASANQNNEREEIMPCKLNRGSSDTDGSDEEPDKLSPDQRKAIEAVKSTFVTLITSKPQTRRLED